MGATCGARLRRASAFALLSGAIGISAGWGCAGLDLPSHRRSGRVASVGLAQPLGAGRFGTRCRARAHGAPVAPRTDSTGHFFGRNQSHAVCVMPLDRQRAPSRQDATNQRVSTMHVNLEVVSIAVSDVDRALDFCHERLGWRVDADIQGGADFRVVQLTPTGSGHVSIAFGVGIPSAAPGSMRHLEARHIRHRGHTRGNRRARGGRDHRVSITVRPARSSPPPGSPAPTPSARATPPTLRSRTRTETAGPSRR